MRRRGGAIRQRQEAWIVQEVIRDSLAQYEREVGPHRDSFGLTLSAAVAGNIEALDLLSSDGASFLKASAEWCMKEQTRTVADMRQVRLETLRALRKHRTTIHDYCARGIFTKDAASQTFTILRDAANLLNTTMFISAEER